MHKAISVIIAVRGNEPFLKQTIANVREKAGCKTEIVVVYDCTEPDTSLNVDQILGFKKAHGVGAARHKGITEAANNLVFAIDAHMDFSQDFGQRILEWHNGKGHQYDVACGCCVPTFENTLKMDLSQKYTGARFCETSAEPGGERWIMSGKWAAQEPGKPIGCIYGACYSFTRKWYRTLGEPWQLLTGWWGDEEYLSAASWLAGGRVVLLDYLAGHHFRNFPSFQTGKIDSIYRTLNRARFVDLLPVTESVRNEWKTLLQFNILHSDTDFLAEQQRDAARPEVQEALERWKKWSWAKLTPWIDKHAATLEQRQADGAKMRPVLKPIESRPTAATIEPVQITKRSQCPRCQSYDSLRVVTTVSREGIQYGRCRKCGLNGHRVTRKGIIKHHWNV